MATASVAHNMQRRRPPSFHEPRLVALSPGAMYRTITLGYGLMPSYASTMAIPDRWAVVAYVRTLQLAGGADVGSLPAAVASDLTRSLP